METHARGAEDGGAPEDRVRTEPLALIVDDDPQVRAMLVAIARREGFAVVESDDGEQAVGLAAEIGPDVIVLDLVLPRLGGFEALERIRERDDQVPVVIVSGSDQPDVTERGMELGAMSFIRKPFEVEELGFAMRRIRAALAELADMSAALPLVRERVTRLRLENSLEQVARAVAYLGNELRHHYPDRPTPHVEMRLALYEALVNAIEHGNLEVGYEGKTAVLATGAAMSELIARRRGEAPFAERRVAVEACYLDDRVTYTVTDEGPGIPAPQRVPELPQDPFALHGRGLVLVRHYMDEVAWNERGNQIRMTRRLPADARPRARPS